MHSVDWNAPAKLIERTDGGSELYFDFRTLAAGTLAELVAQVAMMPASDASRLLIDCAGSGMLTVADIRALAERDDYPRKP